MTSKLGRKKRLLFLVVSVCVLVLSVFAAVSLGSTHIPVSEIIKILADKNKVQEFDVIVWDIRLPRIILALLVGSSLAASGALFQAVIWNPLADPGIIGISSGAKLGLLVSLLIFPNLILLAPVFAFWGAVGAAFLAYVFAWKDGITTVRLILAGVAVNAFFAGASYLITVLNNDKIQTIALWLSGSLAGRSMYDVRLMFPYSAAGLLLALFSIRSSNLLLFDDEKAESLGFNVTRSRILISLVAAFLAAVSTALVGVIGFAGLIVPHIVRLITGPDYKYVLPFSMLNGGIFLLIADTFARTAAAPVELPVGALMSLIGTPFFICLLRKK